MSPLSIRRYRADRLLRREFEAMRERVLAKVRGRLRAAGVALDAGDLEACYAQAWHGLYTTMLEDGAEEIANPEGWLAVVTYRRAIDEHRSHRARVTPMAFEGAYERDLPGELDDRAQLRQLLEGLRARLGPRERQAAALCYLQGLSRADAAARMGISEARMRKLMDGSRTRSPGVAGKVGALLETISAGSYCEEQISLLRGFAFGVLDPGGERYALALAHQRECPACRAHVLSLRGLAAVLPPPPLPFMLGAGVAAGAASGAGAGAGAGAANAGAGAGAGTAIGASGAGLRAAAGVSGAGAGGGWLMAGGLGTKLAVGCLIAVSVGAGCVALTLGPILPIRGPGDERGRAHAAHSDAQAAAGASIFSALGARRASGVASAAGASGLTPAERAAREFGPEQPPRAVSATAARATAARSSAGRATAARAGDGIAAREFAPAGSVADAQSPGGGEASALAPARRRPVIHAGADPQAAAREFGVG
jgi:RNA polymerase sigma factor (sigma-70 family)